METSSIPPLRSCRETICMYTIIDIASVMCCYMLVYCLRKKMCLASLLLDVLVYSCMCVVIWYADSSVMALLFLLGEMLTAEIY